MQRVRINLTGKLKNNCSGKDVILTLIGKIGVDGALYKSLEFVGTGVAELSMAGLKKDRDYIIFAAPRSELSENILL